MRTVAYVGVVLAVVALGAFVLMCGQIAAASSCWVTADRRLSTEPPARRLALVSAAAAGCALGAVLAAAAALHDTVTLVYDTSGNGCRTVIDASARELTRAMVPVRVLVVAWILATGVALSGRLGRTAGRARDSVQVAGTAGAVLLAIWLQFFIGTDALALLVPLAGLWLLVLIAVLILSAVAMAQRHRPAAPRVWGLIGWLLLTGGALPVLLHAVTDSGAVRSC